MSEEVTTQIYLTRARDVRLFGTLSSALETGIVACVRCLQRWRSLRHWMTSATPATLRDVPLIVEATEGRAVDLAKNHDLDGVHVLPPHAKTSRPRSQDRWADDAIVGAACRNLAA